MRPVRSQQLQDDPTEARKRILIAPFAFTGPCFDDEAPGVSEILQQQEKQKLCCCCLTKTEALEATVCLSWN